MEPVYQLDRLQELVTGQSGLLVYFSNDSCSVCKVLKPKVTQLLSERFPKLGSFYVDTEKSPLLAGQHRIFTIPTILIFFEGREHIRLSRNIGLHQLEQAIEKPYRLLFDDYSGKTESTSSHTS